MIRTYTVSELEKISGFTRRTISDYIAKGLLAGPSHRGRGARYPQADVDVLRVVPRVRTLMKKEFPSLKTVSAFLRQLSVRDIKTLAHKSTETAFVAEVRRLRVRNGLMALLPHVPPEDIEDTLGKLTPGQIQGVDTGRYQIGAVVDIEDLLRQDRSAETSSFTHDWRGADGLGSEQPDAEPTVEHQHTNGHANGDDTTPFWSVSWLNGHEEGEHAAVALRPDDVHSLQATVRRLEQKMADTATDLGALTMNGDDTHSDLPLIDESDTDMREPEMTVERRLSEISSRLERLETLLERG